MSLPKLVHSQEFTVHRIKKTVNCQLSILRSKTYPVNCSRGFSLIELLVVIAIIGILTTMVTASFFTAQRKARDTARKSDLKAVQQALELYFQQNGQYPTSFAGQIRCHPPDNTTIGWGNKFSCTFGGPEVVFMQQTPQDPISQSTNGYDYTQGCCFAAPFSYTLSAKLENTNDQDIPPQATLPCTPQSGRNYCVINP